MRYFILLIALIAVTAQAGKPNITRIMISSSFYTDAKKQGLNYNTINSVVRALSWKINFNKLRKNDQFIIIGSNKKYPDALIFKRRNKSIQAFLWRGKYYDKNGKSLQSDFLKVPLNYTRISSKFQLRRYHPILKTYLPHRAVDYVAKYGTPVYAVSDGIVQKRRNIGALGNAVFIKHGADYESVYAHLSKFARGLRAGKKVKKGQIIGYVGSTGRSTGAHLHYEIRFKNKRKNPLTFKFPQQSSLNKQQLFQFKNKIKPYEGFIKNRFKFATNTNGQS